MSKQQEEIVSKRLQQDVDKAYCMIGLLVRHTLCRHSYHSIPSHHLTFTKAKSDGDVASIHKI